MFGLILIRIQGYVIDFEKKNLNIFYRKAIFKNNNFFLIL